MKTLLQQPERVARYKMALISLEVSPTYASFEEAQPESTPISKPVNKPTP